MFLLRTALKNCLGSGIRTWLNVSILSVVLIIMLAYNGLLDGWFERAQRESIEWEYAAGQIWCSQYDPFDALTLADAHDRIPASLLPFLEEGTLTPALVIPASIFPQGRMINIELKGLEAGQQHIKIPVPATNTATDEIPMVIGKQMAESANLKKGDVVMTRWRDKNGTFDARSFVVADIFDTENVNVDKAQAWMRIDQLRELTLMEGEATYLLCNDAFVNGKMLPADTEGWNFKDLNTLLKDILLMEEAGEAKAVFFYLILMSLALLAVFDTQALSIFKRKREIGTYVALGMSPGRVTLLFTLEGIMYSLLAVVVSAIWGTPVLWLFNRTGMEFPSDMYDEALFSDVMYPSFQVSSILLTIGILVVMSGIVSYFPARRIARMNMVQALKGKIE